MPGQASALNSVELDVTEVRCTADALAATTPRPISTVPATYRCTRATTVRAWVDVAQLAGHDGVQPVTDQCDHHEHESEDEGLHGGVAAFRVG